MRDVVAEMDKKCPLWGNLIHIIERLVKREVHRMWVVAERINDERFDAVQTLTGCVAQGAGIGDIAEISNPVADDAHAPMLNGQGDDAHAGHFDGFEWLDGDQIEVGPRRTTAVVAKGVVKAVFDRIESALESVERDGGLHTVVEWAQVVKSADMVLVLVGQQNTMERAHLSRQQLCAHIGASVNQYVAGGSFDESRGAHASVTGVVRGADRAFTADHGYTGGCTGAEERDTHNVSRCAWGCVRTPNRVTAGGVIGAEQRHAPM